MFGYGGEGGFVEDVFEVFELGVGVGEGEVWFWGGGG